MSAASEDPGSGRPAIEPTDRTAPRKRDQARTIALVILAVIITLFAVLNTSEVKVNWIVGSSRAPLIIVIVVSLLVGIILTYFADRRAKKRR
ncbi:MAG TPA: lipopolysaccharide assembly protein LapA domain-containing protein [Solirubrobacteraceae bacterium]|nr:lipopolysaccharide assembly protein LapA domain-containing protein [Solirubrobacteraceae bacterium]